MTISSSLNAGVAGLAANSSRLATIADNIANSATYGYKRAQTDFYSMVLENSNGAYTAGGVRTTSLRLIDERGSLVSTSNSTDIAVRGRGMIPVTTQTSIVVNNGQNPLLLQSTGSFRPDDEGYLRTSAGLVLQGWPADENGDIPAYPRDSVDGLRPVQVDLNQLSGEPTTEVTLAVNLPATSTEAGSGALPDTLSVEYFDNLGKSASLGLTFTPTIPAVGESNEWTFEITDSASGGAVVGQYTLTFDDTRGLGGTLLSVADTIGGAYDPVEGTIEINVAGGPITIDIGLLGSSTGMTQLADAFTPVNVSKNGTSIGTLTSIEIDPNGFIVASFDTGVNRTLYQVPLVDVPNINGLESRDNQTFRITSASGSFFMWDAGDGPTGDVVGYALEESTTDVAGELTSLIQTQRAYSSNAKVIQTVDEMLQETTNIKR